MTTAASDATAPSWPRTQGPLDGQVIYSTPFVTDTAAAGLAHPVETRPEFTG